MLDGVWRGQGLALAQRSWNKMICMGYCVQMPVDPPKENCMRSVDIRPFIEISPRVSLWEALLNL